MDGESLVNEFESPPDGHRGGFEGKIGKKTLQALQVMPPRSSRHSKKAQFALTLN